MGKGFSKLDPQGHEGKTNTWLTPLWLIDALGPFDFDPCGFPNHPTAKKINTLPIDGLSIHWEGMVWLNPPYGRNIFKWLVKLHNHGNGIALVFARTDTQWFHNIRALATDIHFIKGRIKFLKADFTESTNAGHGSMLITFGREADQRVISAKHKGLIAV